MDHDSETHLTHETADLTVDATKKLHKCFCLKIKLEIIIIVKLFCCRTDVDMLLDDIVAKEPLITASKMEQVRKLIISILHNDWYY